MNGIFVFGGFAYPATDTLGPGSWCLQASVHTVHRLSTTRRVNFRTLIEGQCIESTWQGADDAAAWNRPAFIMLTRELEHRGCLHGSRIVVKS